jgi:hypothetical protein
VVESAISQPHPRKEVIAVGRFSARHSLRPVSAIQPVGAIQDGRQLGAPPKIDYKSFSYHGRHPITLEKEVADPNRVCQQETRITA